MALIWHNLHLFAAAIVCQNKRLNHVFILLFGCIVCEGPRGIEHVLIDSFLLFCRVCLMINV